MGSENRDVQLFLGDMIFEYDAEKNLKNIEKHGVSFAAAARVFFDYDRIEIYDEEHSEEEDRYLTIGDTSAGDLVISRSTEKPIQDILFVVHTERETAFLNGRPVEVTRLISARTATGFERGIYYGKYN